MQSGGGCPCGSPWFHRWSCPRLLEFLDVATAFAVVALVLVTLTDPPSLRRWLVGCAFTVGLFLADRYASAARRRHRGNSA